jgi:hypothetical protein
MTPETDKYLDHLSRLVDITSLFLREIICLIN